MCEPQFRCTPESGFRRAICALEKLTLAGRDRFLLICCNDSSRTSNRCAGEGGHGCNDARLAGFPGVGVLPMP
jgi:hypothetical protein